MKRALAHFKAHPDEAVFLVAMLCLLIDQQWGM
jgi:hypothetical protein